MKGKKMNIEKISNTEKFVIHCDRCDTIIRYSAQDTQKDFRCPVCKQDLEPSWENSNKSNESTSSFDSDCIHSLNIGDQITVPHILYGNIEFEVVAKDYLLDGTVTLVSKKSITTMSYFEIRDEYVKPCSNNYAHSTIRQWLNQSFLSGFPEFIQNAIKIPGWDSYDGRMPTTLCDKIVVPSMTELGFSYPYAEEEGEKFSYINLESKFGSTVDKRHSSTPLCWTRTLNSDSTNYACCFSENGTVTSQCCVNRHGVPVCFII